MSSDLVPDLGWSEGNAINGAVNRNFFNHKSYDKKGTSYHKPQAWKNYTNKVWVARDSQATDYTKSFENAPEHATSPIMSPGTELEFSDDELFLCSFFIKFGFCVKGDKCSFIHDPAKALEEH